MWAKLTLLVEKENARKSVPITCIDISGPIDKGGRSRYTSHSTVVLFHYFPMS